jgi:hypothetical protein
MAEKLRIVAFDTVQIEDGDWDPSHRPSGADVWHRRD